MGLLMNTRYQTRFIEQTEASCGNRLLGRRTWSPELLQTSVQKSHMPGYDKWLSRETYTPETLGQSLQLFP